MMNNTPNRAFDYDKIWKMYPHSNDKSDSKRVSKNSIFEISSRSRKKSAKIMWQSWIFVKKFRLDPIMKEQKCYRSLCQ